MAQAPAPSLRLALTCWILTWASAVVGCALALMTGQWLVAVWAVQVAIVGMGCMLAVRQWQLWRAIAIQLTAMLERRSDL